MTSSARPTIVCGDRQAERLGGGEIDRQSKLCRELDRELARPRAVNYPVHIFGRAPDDVIQIRAELQQAAIPCKRVRIRGGRGARQPPLVSELGDAAADALVSVSVPLLKNEWVGLVRASCGRGQGRAKHGAANP